MEAASARDVGGSSYMRWYRQWHWNVHLTAFNSCVWNIFFSLALGPLYDNYLFSLYGNSNTMVGIIESVSGMTAIAMTLPVAWAVEKFDHVWLVKVRSRKIFSTRSNKF